MNGNRLGSGEPLSEDRKLGEKLFWLIVVAAALHMVYYYPLLPDRVASHFDAHGRPNGWSGKTMLFSLYACVVILIVIISTATRFLLTRLPVSLINLPNRDYWLAPERRAGSMAMLSRHMSGFWSATLVFLMSTMHLAFRVNLGWSRAVGDWFFALLLGYILFTIVWMAGLIRRFAKKPERR